MYLVFHRLKFETNIAEQTTYKDDWQLCDTVEEARKAISTLHSIHGSSLKDWGIASIVEASEASWLNKQSFGLED